MVEERYRAADDRSLSRKEQSANGNWACMYLPDYRPPFRHSNTVTTRSELIAVPLAPADPSAIGQCLHHISCGVRCDSICALLHLELKHKASDCPDSECPNIPATRMGKAASSKRHLESQKRNHVGEDAHSDWIHDQNFHDTIAR